ncbi:HCNGP-like protein-domain-containing protein [Phaeosphaeria sp. MPI-PUGE-AT-0046c]|nr:HCNGP-like protein-domain-containing protein [Phaeosphaeria sp. MPI-PUGE-AT-0046c]
MLGIDYESSDEEQVAPVVKSNVSPGYRSKELLIATNIELTNTLTDAEPQEPLPGPAPPAHSVAPDSLNGPAQGPTVSLPSREEDPIDDVPHGSPYTSNRAMIQNLTLPTVPNFDIPPSPPGSPPQKATKKFAQFLELKKKGQHFNQRLEGSSVLRDPGHLRRLLDFAGINGGEQYVSALSEDVAVPVAFPPWAYVEELKASQKQILKAREQQKSKLPREAVDFVSATKSGTSSTVGTPGKAANGDQAGRTSSHTTGKRKELEHRSRDSSQSRHKRQSGSRSPKRRRSRSRERK